MGQVSSEAQIDNNFNHSQEHSMTPSPYSINSKCIGEVNDDISLMYDNNSEISLTDLAKEYERVGQDVIESFGLNKLGNTIEETASILKNLKSPRAAKFNKQRFTKFACSCQQWDPNFCDTDKKWYWNVYNEKYQSITPNGENVALFRNHQPMPNENFISTNVKESRVQSKPLVKEYCEYCLMKMRNKISSQKNDIAMMNSNDDLITSVPKSHGEITNMKWSSSKFGEFISDRDEIIMDKKIKNKQLCSHGTKYSRKSELKNCPCGCGKIIEIIEKSVPNEM